MFVPSIADARAAWERVEPRLHEIAGGCIIVSETPYRPTRKCGGRQVRLARIAYIAAGGTIPESATCLRHTCDDIRCVAPGHMVPGDDLANAHDRRDRGRGVGWIDGICARGHDTAVTGVYRPRRYNSAIRGRTCAACVRAGARAVKAARKAAAKARADQEVA